MYFYMMGSHVEEEGLRFKVLNKNSKLQLFFFQIHYGFTCALHESQSLKVSKS